MSKTEDHCYGPDPEPEITPENALVMIAHELRHIKRTLWHAAFDPNCETTLSIGDKLDNLNSFDDASGGVGDQAWNEVMARAVAKGNLFDASMTTTEPVVSTETRWGVRIYKRGKFFEELPFTYKADTLPLVVPPAPGSPQGGLRKPRRRGRAKATKRPR